MSYPLRSLTLLNIIIAKKLFYIILKGWKKQEFGFTETCRRKGKNVEVLVENGTVKFLISQHVTDDSNHEDHTDYANTEAGIYTGGDGTLDC